MTGLVNGRDTARDPWSIGFGAVVVAFALVSLFVWFPNDIKGDFITLNQGSNPEPGDAFFPVMLAGLILVLGAGQVVYTVFSRAQTVSSGRLTFGNLKFLCLSFAMIFAGLAIMYWLGPLVTDAARHLGLLEQTYRQLIDTAPYKYLGYITGGFTMTVGLIAMAEGRIRLPALLAVVAALALMILVLDILLYNVQLPPNADH